VVNFNGVASSDVDGAVVRYVWDFKDVAPAGAVGPLATHRYRAPGIYNPTLTVFDDKGASATTSVTVQVFGPIRPPSCSLAQLSAAFMRVNSIHDAASATIRVQDQYGNPVRRALVYVTISGLAGSTGVVRTNDLGVASITSPTFRRAAGGSVVFTVTKVEAPGLTYVTSTPAPVITVAPTVTVGR